MGSRVRAAFWAVAVLLILVAFVPNSAAQEQGPCPIVHVEDETGDVTATTTLDTSDIDVDFACFSQETETDFLLVIVTAGDISPTATQILLYDFNFQLESTDLSAGADIRSGSQTPTGQASAVSVEGNVLTITVPKSNIGYENEVHVGQPITSLFVETETTTAPSANVDAAEGDDRAPEEGFGQNYIGGSLADPSQDTDKDGVPDRNEIENGTDPRSIDGDGDGLLDGDNVTLDSDNQTAQNYTNAGITSEENDDGTITFFGEGGFGTNATDPDTDDDGLIDGGTAVVASGSERAEKLQNATVEPTRTQGGNLIFAGELSFNGDPLVADSDGDGLSDGEEILGTRNEYETAAFSGYPGSTDPSVADSDGDNLTDFEEVTGSHMDMTFTPTDPNSADTDGDGLSDMDEIMGQSSDGTPTDPTEADSDGDGFNDREEVDAGTDPTDPESQPQIIEEAPAEATDWVYALLSTVLVLSVIVLAIFGILVRWG